MNNRREVPRQAAGWPGMCNITGDSGEWHKCRVVDISMLGTALALEHPSPLTLVGRRVSVYVPILLEGEVTNAGRTLEDAVRVGIKFDRRFGDSDVAIATLHSAIRELNFTSGRQIRR